MHKYFETWLTDVVKPNVRPRTYENYRYLTARHIEPALGKVKLQSLQPAHLQRLYNALLEKGLAPKTVKNIHGVIRKALGQAVLWDTVPRNVALAVQPPKVDRPEIATLTDGEVARLLDTTRETRWEALLSVALASGMRQGELLGLKWGDIDLAGGSIYVRRQLGRDKTLAAPKSSKGQRQIDLPGAVVEILKEHKRRQNEERLGWGPAWDGQDLVFCTHQGRPLSWRNVGREFKKLLERAGVPDISFHGLRHTSASLLLKKGVHPKVVQERLGHSQIGITLDTYSHLVPSLGRDAAERLEGVFAPRAAS